MRKFKATPAKKFIGMVILFVLIPLFLLWYVVFFLDNRPDAITLTIIACIAVLAVFFYWKYRKQAAALATPEPGSEDSFEEEPAEDKEFQESEDEGEQEEDSFEEKPTDEELEEAPVGKLSKKK